MDVRIERKAAFRVAGVAGRGPADRGSEWVPPLWQAFAGQSQALKDAAGPGAPRLWGLMSDTGMAFAPWDGEGLYLAGVEVNDGPLPEGFAAWTAPGHDYLVVPASPEGMCGALDRALQDEIPSRAMELAGAVFERYPDPSDPTRLELWCPIRPLPAPAAAIGGLPRVAYFLGDTSYLTPFIGSLWSIHSRLGGGDEYSGVLALSGAGIRLRWGGWDPSNVDIAQCCENPFEMYLRALRAMGYGATLRRIRPAFGDEGPTVDFETAKREIASSIDAGLPVPALGVIGPTEGCAVAGYAAGGDQLMGWNYFQADSGQPANRYFRVTDWFDSTWAYFLISRGERPSMRDAALEMLRAAAAHARSGPVRGAPVGLAAWRAMLDQLAHDDFSNLPVTAPGGPAAGQHFWAGTLHGRFMIYCDALCQVHERGFTAAYFENLAAAFPDWAAELTDAAAHLRACATYGGYLWRHLTMDEAGYAKFAQPEIRAALADEGRRAMAEDRAAIEAIERLLHQIEGGTAHD
ncbi:MAG: GyrI-like domain-containing protein [Clostridiales bacterium]|nr:GyrI-like domain-containing protein [Clostridiales bacterium]